MPRFEGTTEGCGKGVRKPETPETLPKRLGWFVLFWIGGVGAVSALAYAIRWMIL
ncbi:hypothetical protein FP2506_09581 [Fulvimarina pelagi HTCC2506]|uniref:DUF2474 domain-containing protein n=1 Tax=Fulvimarina pelagi HTCC2506 TaxID=314231 RepID=Q0G5I0_9HYPH|nr:hypothetical protein [Fulvimarina pelagi]EAU43084.1 hypothetical protein FP2506_09581 [Fulvimarina pelagi HTCC2506]